jgi:hypothetical protein
MRRMAGYSQRALAAKLGVKPGSQMVVLGAPPEYASLLGDLPTGATLHGKLPKVSAFIHRFVRHQAELAREFPQLADALADDGVLWISWPKRSSGVATDLKENVVRDLGLQRGLVDVKVCAIDDVWSGLKFVRRLENRVGKKSRKEDVKELTSKGRRP